MKRRRYQTDDSKLDPATIIDQTQELLLELNRVVNELTNLLKVTTHDNTDDT